MTIYDRLKKRSDFLKVASSHKSRVCPAFILQVGSTENLVSRVGFTASRKIGGAVERNRGKRRLRVLARNLPLTPLHDYVFIARKAILTRDFMSLEKDLRWAIKSIMEEMSS